MINVSCGHNGDDFVKNKFTAYVKDGGDRFIKEFNMPVLKDPSFKKTLASLLTDHWGREIKETDLNIDYKP